MDRGEGRFRGLAFMVVGEIGNVSIVLLSLSFCAQQAKARATQQNEIRLNGC